MQGLIEAHLLRPGRGTVTTSGMCAKCFILPSTHSIVFSFDPSTFPLVCNVFDQEYIASELVFLLSNLPVIKYLIHHCIAWFSVTMTMAGNVCEHDFKLAGKSSDIISEHISQAI